MLPTKRKFRIGQLVQTRSGLVGKIMGSALYVWGVDYRVKVAGKAKTMYRHERDLTKPTKKKTTGRKK